MSLAACFAVFALAYLLNSLTASLIPRAQRGAVAVTVVAEPHEARS